MTQCSDCAGATRVTRAVLAGALLMLAIACSGGGGDSVTSAVDWKSAVLAGGDTTNLQGNQSSFGFDTPASNLAGDTLDTHLFGDVEFERAFIRAISASFPGSDGVGPAFNNNACIACHARDGRANYSIDATSAPSGQFTKLGANEGVFLRISVENGNCEPRADNRFCEPVAVPGFSRQLFHRGVLGLRTDSAFTGQADVYVAFEDAETIRYKDGTSVTLRRPRFEVRNPYDSPGEVQPESGAGTSRLFQDDVRFSPRIGPPVFGTGLLEAIPASAILGLEDPDDINGDGISGRVNWVLDPVAAARGEPPVAAIGRFGWKAASPSVLAQTSSAYANDMGLTHYLSPTESIEGTSLHDAYLSSNPEDNGQANTGFEVSEDVVRAVAFYTSTLAVPARRNVDDQEVLHGADLFQQAGCTACHQPSFVTGTHNGFWSPVDTTAAPQLESQNIFPYTDLLLHDMGDGLADGRTEFAASGREWRTRPLWGLGLTQTVNPLAGFLHDGRARTIEEAILWHGGEAQASNNNFQAMDAGERAALLKFLGSL